MALVFVAWCLVVQVASAFQPSPIVSTITSRRNLQYYTKGCAQHTITYISSIRSSSKLNTMMPEIYDNMQSQLSQPHTSTATAVTSILLSEDVESWRQYVPLVVSVAVIIDILLGSPLANMALAPMKRASEKGATGDSDGDGSSSGGGGGGGSLFSACGGSSDGGGEDKAASRSKERVDSEAIAQAALDKAMGTLELKRFLEENKTDEQRYEDVRKKIDQQLMELDD